MQAALFLILATGAAASDKMEVMAGEWTFTTVGEKGKHGQDPKALSQTFTLTFLTKEEDDKDFTGRPFRFTIAESQLRSAKPGGSVSRKAVYERGNHGYDIDFRGKITPRARRLRMENSTWFWEKAHSRRKRNRRSNLPHVLGHERLLGRHESFAAG